MTDNPWRPSRRRLVDALLAALAPATACSVALGGLATWAAVGKAGSPARIAVSSGRVLLPYADGTETAAFFDIANIGGADDRLVKVTSSGTAGEIGLSRHRTTKSGAAYRSIVVSATVAAGSELAMSPHGLDVTVGVTPPARAKPRAGGTYKARWRAGDLVSFTLHFERSGAIKAPAVVIRPSDNSS
ncbi:copper chaperone PCu(A)C [Streptomyces decoyicus]|uniref:Copper chaperone PCu(A)C n=1 Tax=Streptomyces decoyicus TaxID=249567 RepID=A0ABZ1F8T7_9ACTN|nr:copper chaperone PCu(A)C [Streptomyces decoyicus]WSB66729.1 copper chaperone PCu(A)C [Streptomyces decoyicus]